MGSAGPGVPAASADSCRLGWRDRAALTFPREHGAQHSSASGVVPGSSDVEKFIGNVEIGEPQDLQM